VSGDGSADAAPDGPPAGPGPVDGPKPGRDAKRLFIGIRPSVASIAQLGEVAEALARRAQTAGVPIRWLPPATYHVTVKFLGWGRPEAVPAIVDAIGAAAAATAPFGFTTARLGAFPARDRASVVWAGVDSAPLARLAAAIDAGCAALGFARERRPFHGHVTLGRLRDPRAVSDVLLPFSEQTFSDTTVQTITLFESLTKPTGSEYRQVARIDLQPPRATEKRQTRPLEPTPQDATSGPSSRSLSPLEGIHTDDGWPRGQGPSSDE
jgi:RNA 2',3'-cyclic 3'-phosphodiesterase